MTSRLLDDAGVRAAVDVLAAWTESQRAYAGLPGLSVAIVHDQEVVWARGFGLADLARREPAGPDTLYRIASITKLFTSTAVLQLRDAGALRLDDPVARHLGWFRLRRADPEAPEITIRHLLTHTAGLPREAGFPYWTDGEFPSAEQIRQRLPEQDAALPPDTAWKYSNLGLTLAGEIVAAVSGRPWADYVHERILEPLGMRRTWAATPPADEPGLATGYTRRLPGGAPRTAVPFTDSRGIAPAANMTTCVSDLAKFAMLQFREGRAGGAQVLSSSTLREMQRVHWLEPDWAAGWGLGFRVMRERGKTYVGHGGRLRGHRSILHLSPAERVGVMVMINADDGEPPLFAEKAMTWVAPAIVKAVTAAGVVGPPAGWERYTGRYRSPWADTQVLLLDGGLAMLDPSRPDPMLTLARLHPVTDHTFRIETKDGYGHHGELVTFHLNPAGEVTRIQIGENYSAPIPNW